MAANDEQWNRTEQDNGAQNDGRLKVKLKLPKMLDEDGINAAGEEVKSHRCVDCNKSFSSGKALGGHMSSAHIQPNKDYGLKKPKTELQKQGRSTASSSSSMGDLIICKLCGRDFPSRKSLFGHMRCHPEREWRGMEPPSQLTKAGFGGIGFKQESDDEDQVDSGPSMASVGGLHESLTGWRGRAKRGRPPSKQDEPVYAAFKQILKLLSDDSGSGQQQKEDEQVVDSSCCYSRTPPGPESSDLDKDNESRKRDFPVKKLEICEPEAGDDESGDRSLVVRMKGDDRANVDCLGKGKGPLLQSLVMYSSSEDSDSHDFRVEPSVRAKHRTSDERGSSSSKEQLELEESSSDAQKIVLTNGASSEVFMCHTEVIDELSAETQENELEGRANQLEPRTEPQKSQIRRAQGNHLGVAVSPGKHVCNVCNKTFLNPQALGGHRSSHNKLKVCIINRNSVPSRRPRGSTVANRSPAPSVVTVQQQQHQSAAQDVDSSSHSCITCNKTFSSSLALRDHIRCHLDQPGSSSSPSKTSPPHEEAIEERNVVGFNLNMMPDEELEDGNGTSGGKS